MSIVGRHPAWECSGGTFSLLRCAEMESAVATLVLLLLVPAEETLESLHDILGVLRSGGGGTAHAAKLGFQHARGEPSDIGNKLRFGGSALHHEWDRHAVLAAAGAARQLSQ